MSASKGALFGGALWQRILLGRAQLLGYLDRYYQVFMWNRRLQHFHCHSAERSRAFDKMRRMRSLRISKAPESWNREGCVRSFSQDLRQSSITKGLNLAQTELSSHTGSQSYASAAAGKSYDMATLDPSSRESEMTRPWTSP
ncbi:hypothetical protein BN1723_001634 [Verticillium longisporum]|uniref:Uncharacterized protein n=1 Tax=Verticillium longisporum TaxID=100787 RepID=A0A0G4KKR9_VERLO|nr:hypothetical protein BN1723_001634 [Verticillium longisporum]